MIVYLFVLMRFPAIPGGGIRCVPCQNMGATLSGSFSFLRTWVTHRGEGRGGEERRGEGKRGDGRRGEGKGGDGRRGEGRGGEGRG